MPLFAFPGLSPQTVGKTTSHRSLCETRLSSSSTSATASSSDGGLGRCYVAGLHKLLERAVDSLTRVTINPVKYEY